ncbi:DUF2750 domain-containing protein [Cellulomonas cellasea]|uniref:DUF2750 domain-containing protein n=2 Tax=Cellulomonas cellasea TaxID=43670 RepID=A0A0A0B784_9CELL|nr:DUF2750 domain-containing protein [Cellulomonas cellasea]KGM02012.1 hypothetical protein Q760_15970 [Cellulomonas cellasea DSM 20118]GEA86635.1 hypothetical protein CCE01nite_05840 [Cellulomonas cellasea]
MRTSAAHAAAFYRDALALGSVWGVADSGGLPTVTPVDGTPAMPFWSTRGRAARVLAAASTFAGFEPVESPLGEWRTRWLPGLAGDGIHVGLNWSGPHAQGYDLPPADVERNLAAREAVTRGN